MVPSDDWEENFVSVWVKSESTRSKAFPSVYIIKIDPALHTVFFHHLSSPFEASHKSRAVFCVQGSEGNDKDWIVFPKSNYKAKSFSVIHAVWWDVINRFEKRLCFYPLQKLSLKFAITYANSANPLPRNRSNIVHSIPQRTKALICAQPYCTIQTMPYTLHQRHYN